jgi:hypothetical protein
VALHVKSWNTNLKGIYFIWMKERKRSDPKWVDIFLPLSHQSETGTVL